MMSDIIRVGPGGVVTKVPNNIPTVRPRKIISVEPEQQFYIGLQFPLYDHQKGITRDEMYSCRTTNVTIPEYHAVMEGVEEILEETGRNVKIIDYDNFRIDRPDFNSPEWYQERSLIGNGQVDASNVSNLLKKEPFQKDNPHFDLIVLDRDITTRDSDGAWLVYVFGLATYPNNVISVARTRYIQDNTLKEACLQVIGAHEFGHNLGLVNRSYNVGTENIEAGHCLGENGPCIMQQFNIPNRKTIGELTAAIIDEDRDTLLCPDCTDEIGFISKHYKMQDVFW
jgi:hypothetical protein